MHRFHSAMTRFTQAACGQIFRARARIGIALLVIEAHTAGHRCGAYTPNTQSSAGSTRTLGPHFFLAQFAGRIRGRYQPAQFLLVISGHDDKFAKCLCK